MSSTVRLALAANRISDSRADRIIQSRNPRAGLRAGTNDPRVSCRLMCSSQTVCCQLEVGTTVASHRLYNESCLHCADNISMGLAASVPIPGSRIMVPATSPASWLSCMQARKHTFVEEVGQNLHMDTQDRMTVAQARTIR